MALRAGRHGQGMVIIAACFKQETVRPQTETYRDVCSKWQKLLHCYFGLQTLAIFDWKMSFLTYFKKLSTL
jgi:hypothetical protein